MQQHQQEGEPSFFQRNALSIKGIIIFFLMLALLIPAVMVSDIINERQSRQFEAANEVSNKWGLSQTISGPVLVVPFEKINRDQDGKEFSRETKHAYFLPDGLQVVGEVFPEIRYRGIFEVVVYNSKMTLTGNFPHPEVEKIVPAGATILWDKAVLTLGISDLRGLEEQVSLEWNQEKSFFDPGMPVTGIVGSGIHVPMKISASEKNGNSFKMEISLKGSTSLFFTPVGKVNDVKISSNWPDPSFTGVFLPDEKNITPQGFDAHWKVLNLNRNYPQSWATDLPVMFEGSNFGIDFLLPVDNYQKSMRSVKYAILFIGLTFLVVFFIEMRGGRRVHPFQYALIGLALVIFYTLLVSISEHTTFNIAYGIAALMTIGLTTLYAKALFQDRKMAFLVGGTLVLLYGFLFTVLQLKDYALLIGSLGLFAILAAVMYFSRKIEWYGGR